MDGGGTGPAAALAIIILFLALDDGGTGPAADGSVGRPAGSPSFAAPPAADDRGTGPASASRLRRPTPSLSPARSPAAYDGGTGPAAASMLRRPTPSPSFAASAADDGGIGLASASILRRPSPSLPSSDPIGGLDTSYDVRSSSLPFNRLETFRRARSATRNRLDASYAGRMPSVATGQPEPL